MGRNLMGRVRWGNLALVVGACAVLAFGLAWAFSSSTTARLPGDGARPLVPDAPIATIEPPVVEIPHARRDPEPEVRPKRRARRDRPRERAKRHRPPRERVRATPTPAPAAPAPQTITPAPRTTPPPRRQGGGGEFGFEGR